MQPFVIPSIFTAVDKYSGVMNNMGYATQNVNNKIETLNSKSEKLFNKLTPGLSQANKQFLSFASSAAIATAIIGTAKFSSDSLMKYEEELANLQALTGKDAPFDAFKKNIGEVAKFTKKSSIEVAQAFTSIANNQPELAKDADALAEVTKQSILLAKAAKMELEPAGQAVTQILNQYGKGADYAAKTVQTLAAGSVAGSSEIMDTAEAIKQFGTVAAVAGVKIDESVALIELGSKFDKGAEAGVKFRNILLNMTGAKVLDKLALKDLAKAKVNLDIVSNKALPLNERLLEMSKIAGDTNAIMHVFGKENAAMAAGILTNAGAFDTMLAKLNDQNAITYMAEKNNNTLRATIDQVKNSFINLLTSSENSSKGIEMAKNAARFLADNMGTIVTVGLNVIKFFALWKLSILAVKGYMIAYNVVFGINNALQKRSLFYTEGNIIAKRADLVATTAIATANSLWSTSIALATGNTVALNAALLANPIGAVILSVVALTLASYGLYKVFDELSKQNISAYERKEAARQEAFAIVDLRDKYLALGETLKDAEKHAVIDAKLNIAKGLVNAKLKLASPIEEERQQGVEEINVLSGKAEQLNNFSNNFSKEATKDRGGRYSNSLDTRGFAGSIGGNETMSPSIDWAKNKPAINPKITQAQVIHSMTKTNTTNSTLTLINETTSEAKMDSGGETSSVKPKGTTTYTLSK